MSKYISDFYRILTDLANLGVKISDEHKGLRLQNSLPDEYEHLIITLLYGKNGVKFDDISNTLLNNECRKKDKQLQTGSSEALVVRGRFNERKSSENEVNLFLSQEVNSLQ